MRAVKVPGLGHWSPLAGVGLSICLAESASLVAYPGSSLMAPCEQGRVAHLWVSKSSLRTTGRIIVLPHRVGVGVR